jgi:hypothetical protein
MIYEYKTEIGLEALCTQEVKTYLQEGKFWYRVDAFFGLTHEKCDQRPTRPRIGVSCEVPLYVGGAGLHGEHMHVSLIWGRLHAESVVGGFALVCG